MEDKFYGFGGLTPTPARPTALALAEATIELIEANKALNKARKKVPNYTAQWDSDDFTAEAQERYNRAADAYEGAVKASMS